MQAASGVRQATRRTPPYPLGMRQGVQVLGIRHQAVDAIGGVFRATGLVQTSSVIAFGTGDPCERAGGYPAHVPGQRGHSWPGLEKDLVDSVLRVRYHALDSAEQQHP